VRYLTGIPGIITNRHLQIEVVSLFHCSVCYLRLLFLSKTNTITPSCIQKRPGRQQNSQVHIFHSKSSRTADYSTHPVNIMSSEQSETNGDKALKSRAHSKLRSVVSLDDKELASNQSVLVAPDQTETEAVGIGGSHVLAEELKTTPLIWWRVKSMLENFTSINQYAVLGHVSSETTMTKQGKSTRMPVLLNTNSPWSAFVCESQGSGKSQYVDMEIHTPLMVC
jgi:hypothetical protein